MTNFIPTGAGKPQPGGSAWIQLTKPLRVEALPVAGLALQGVLAKIGRSALLIRPQGEVRAWQKVSTLRVELATAQSYTLTGEVLALNAAELTFAVQGEQALLTLADLLGQVRKSQHLDLCAHHDVEASDRFTGFSDLHFIPKALPEINESELDCSQNFLGRSFSLPLLITGMTGGVEKGALINERLAEAAVAFGIPMGIGSQRVALENPAYVNVFKLKDKYPGLFLIGNLGAAQLLKPEGLDLCQRAVAMVEADALAIHLNVVQEAVQIEGDRYFKGLLARLHALSEALTVPLLVKEVGSGLDLASAQALVQAGVAALDVGGRGGTSWGYIEGLRSSELLSQTLGETFRNWGIPTAYNLAALKSQGVSLPLVATGGIRDGLTVAKACAIGATMAGIGLPLMRAALVSREAVMETLAGFAQGLRITMLATGSQNLSDLSRACQLGVPYAKEFVGWMAQLADPSRKQL